VITLNRKIFENLIIILYHLRFRESKKISMFKGQPLNRDWIARSFRKRAFSCIMHASSFSPKTWIYFLCMGTVCAVSQIPVWWQDNFSQFGEVRQSPSVYVKVKKDSNSNREHQSFLCFSHVVQQESPAVAASVRVSPPQMDLQPTSHSSVCFYSQWQKRHQIGRCGKTQQCISVRRHWLIYAKWE